METLAPPPFEATTPHAVSPELAIPIPGDQLQEQPEAIPATSSRAKKIFVGEVAANVLEGAMMAGGVSLPISGVVGIGMDIKTYAPDSPESVTPPRMQKIRRDLGILALNLATGYAIQKGVPVFLDVAQDSLQGTPVETGLQLASKIGVMSGATSLLNKRMGG